MVRWKRLWVLALMAPLAGAAEPGVVELVAGGGDSPDGSPARVAALKAPFGVDFDREGTLYLVELLGERVRKVSPDGILTTVAGTGATGDSGDGGPGSRATFNGMHSLVAAPDGSILVADTWNNRVRRLDPATGRVEAFAGTGAKGDSIEETPAAEATFGGIYCIALDPAGRSLILTDLDNRKIRVLDMASKKVRTIAGNGQKGAPADGSVAAEAPLVDPRAAVGDARGNIYILERGGHALRRVDPAGRIETLVGTGKPGDEIHEREPLRTGLRGPKHLCIDQDGSVLIADTENHRILRFDPGSRTIRKVAGTGKKGTAGIGGPPGSLELNQPHGVYPHADGSLYISDSSNNRILRIVR